MKNEFERYAKEIVLIVTFRTNISAITLISLSETNGLQPIRFLQ